MVVGLHDRPARWLGRIWSGLRAWMAGAEEIPLDVGDLIQDFDPWEDVPHVAPPVRPRVLPPPIPVEVRRAVPAPAPLPVQAPRPAPKTDSAWDEVIARAQASIVRSTAEVGMPQIALTPAPVWNDGAEDAGEWSARLGRAKARARTAGRRGRPSTGEVRWAELMSAVQSDVPSKPASGSRRKRRRSSSISLACPSPAEDVATPPPVVITVRARPR